MTVKVAVPVEINDSILTSSGIPEPDPSVGEVAWEDEASKYEDTTITGPIDYWLNFEMTRTGHGELIVVGALRNTWALVKFDVNGSLVWSTEPGTDTGNPESDMNFIGCSVNGDDLIMFWHNDNNQSANFNKVYRQVITGIAAQGPLPSYSGASSELVNFPSSVRDSENKRLLEQGNLIFASHNDGVTISQNISVSALSATDGELIITNTESFNGGRVNSISPDGDGGFYVCAIDRKIIQFSAQLERVKESNLPLVKSKFERVAYYNNIITVGGLTSTNQNVMILTDVNNDFNLLSSYKKDDEVLYLPNHTKYICLANETFSNPSETATGDANAEWLKIGPSNRWSMLDKFIKNKTKSTVDFTVEITPGVLFDTVSFFGIIGVDTIRVEALRGVDVIYDETKSFVDLNSIVDWYSYFFYQLTHREEDVFFNIPPYLDTKLRVTFTGTGSGIEVGAMPFGMSQTMGVVCINTKSDTKDYSDIEYDQFGELSEIERPVVSYNTYEIDVKKTLAKSIERKLKDLRGKNALWVGDIGDDQQLITYGRYERSPLTYSNHSIVSYSVKVRGSI